MKYFASLTLALSIILCTFFVLFSTHPQNTIQNDVKQYLDTGKGELPFTNEANSHMHDVYKVLVGLRIAAAVLCIYSLYTVSKKKASLPYAGGIILLILLLIACTPWEVAFAIMHNIFFPQGNWTFPLSSLLIQTYPEQFFIQFTVRWAILLFFLAIILLTNFWWKRFFKFRKKWF